MKNVNKQKLNYKEIMLWSLVTLMTLAALCCTYYFNFSVPIESLIWIGWLVIAGVLVSLTAMGKKIFEFAKEAKIELQKVVWPTRKETIQTTSIVMIMVTMTGFILWGLDSGMIWIIGKLTRLG